MAYFYRRTLELRSGVHDFVGYAVLPTEGMPDLDPVVAGKRPVLVQSAMGLSSITTTMNYSHLQAEHLRALVEEQTSVAAAAKEASR